MSTLIDEINAGKHDADLEELEKIVKFRLRSVRSSRSPGEYLIGDKIKFNDFCGTKYIQGHTGVVVGKKKTKVVVQLDRPVGRFAITKNGKVESASITVPVSIIDKV